MINHNISKLTLPPGGTIGNSKIFPYYEQNEIIFLYIDGQKNAVKYNIIENYHRIIKKSATDKIWALHPTGIRVANYFWLFGGSENYRG